MKKIGPDAFSLDVNGHCALLSNTRLILIDTGTQPDAKELLEDIEKTGYKPSDIQNIIITHTHPDHVGGLSLLKTLSNARIAAHEIEAKFISQIKAYDGPPGAEFHKHPGTPVDDLLQDGQIYEGLLVIYTPGHTPGHISLYDKEADLLIAGDAIRHDSDGLNPMANKYNYDIPQHHQSIRKLAKYSFQSLIVGHGEPVISNASEMLDSLIKSDRLQ